MVVPPLGQVGSDQEAEGDLLELVACAQEWRKTPVQECKPLKVCL